MNITLNGKIQDIPDGSTLTALVEQHVRTPEHAVAEVNGTIVARDQWAATRLQNGACIELVTFVGGG